MTAAQFDALAQLLSLRAGPAAEAARLVLVQGLRPADAARAAGCSAASVNNALARCRRGVGLAMAVAGKCPAAVPNA